MSSHLCRYSYLPVLRFKRAEKAALERLDTALSERIRPLLEPIPKNVEYWAARDDEPLASLGRQLTDFVAGYWRRPAFFDLALLNVGSLAQYRTAIRAILEDGRAAAIDFAPVLRLGDSAQQEAIGALPAPGVAVRIALQDFSRFNLSDALASLLARTRTEAEQDHVIIDIGYQTGDRRYPDIGRLCSQLPMIGRWQSVAVIAGSFPVDLSNLSVGSHLIPRIEWRAWTNQAGGMQGNGRPLVFGDYTIQHALFREPPERANFSASIRYTIADSWLIMRGEGAFNEAGPGFAQWPANAQLLCARSEFCGPDYSYGDRYIELIGSQVKPTGSAETWLRAGINHHLTFVARQVTRMVAS